MGLSVIRFAIEAKSRSEEVNSPDWWGRSVIRFVIETIHEWWPCAVIHASHSMKQCRTSGVRWNDGIAAPGIYRTSVLKAGIHSKHKYWRITMAQFESRIWSWATLQIMEITRESSSWTSLSLQTPLLISLAGSKNSLNSVLASVA